MTSFRTLTLTVLAAAVLAACAGMPADNVGLNQARSDYRGLQADPLAQRLAAPELRQAADALALAEAAQARRDDSARVDQLAYLARQRVALAREAANRKSAEEAVAKASAERDRLRLAARTREADVSAQSAATARRDASGSQQQAMASQQQAAASQQQAAVAQQQAGEAERRSAALETELQALKATRTDRGMVMTLGDVLFDTGRSEIKAGALHNLEPLGSFLKAHPERRAQIEGHTDATGGSAANQALSQRRAEAVLAALLTMGVDRRQLSAQGWGESRPLAGEDSAGGRQMNRRVEIVLPEAPSPVSAR